MIETVAETGSTNADLLARLTAGERVPEGHWLVAQRQIAGRGRQGREWFDGAGNFMGSTLVHRGEGDPPSHTLALVAGLAVHETVLPYCPDASALTLKWPNDLMYGTAKLCGILLEAQGDSIVVGIGCNLAVAPPVPGRRTIALSEIGPAPQASITPFSHSFMTAPASIFSIIAPRASSLRCNKTSPSCSAGIRGQSCSR